MAEWLGDQKMDHVRGAPFHPQTQGKSERYRESLNNVTPADVCFRRDKAIIREREKVRKLTIQNRRLQHQKQAA